MTRVSLFKDYLAGGSTMAIKSPIIAEIANRTWCINEYGMDSMFLLEGDSKALLIDTGTGTFDIPRFIRQYTDKPVLVALTHGHVDHAGGMHMFPEVYMHPDEFITASSITASQRNEFAKQIIELSDNTYALDFPYILEGTYDTKLLPLSEGETIHLGSRDIEIYETPGHTPGGLSFLDKKERIIFTGDACNSNTLLAINFDNSEKCTVNRAKSKVGDLLSTAKKIQSLQPYYDRNYNGHIGYASDVAIIPMSEQVTRDIITLCNGLLDRTIVGEAASTHNMKSRGCLLAKYGSAQIQYVPEQLERV